ncbi:LGFP repeat-containing protein, partial [Kineococcus glutinatus]|uniref:LGFP repeat-containing protein n=1 Tax=Kineococcus glutinatus TaxID=1070872 RepID=UPI003CD0B0DF
MSRTRTARATTTGALAALALAVAAATPAAAAPGVAVSPVCWGVGNIGSGWLVTVEQDGTVAAVRLNEANTVPVATSPAPASVTIRWQQALGEDVALLDAGGRVLASVPAPATYYCDRWESRQEFVERSGAPGTPLAIGAVPATPTERTPQGVEVYRADTGALYLDPLPAVDVGHVVKGAIYDRYRREGEFRGRLGYPTTSERQAATYDAYVTDFNGASIWWTPARGTLLVQGVLRTGYEQRGSESGELRLPVGEEFGPLRAGGRGQHFEGGSLYSAPTS